MFNAMNKVTYDDKIVVEEVEVTDEEGNTKAEEKLVRYIYVTMHSIDYLEAAEQMEILVALAHREVVSNRCVCKIKKNEDWRRSNIAYASQNRSPPFIILNERSFGDG